VIAALSTAVSEAAVQSSTGQDVAFWILAPLAVLAAIGLVAARKAVHGALMLAVVMICLAVLYLLQDGPFLGVVQVVVYTGAVMMLFLFVLMLVGIDSSDSLVETLRAQRVLAIVVGLGFGILLIGGLGNAATTAFVGLDDANAVGNVEALAELLFLDYVWAFELTGALLITATVGAMVLAHRERVRPRATQRELAERRFREGGRATPLPSPGVYARHNAADVPALLPDGSFSGESVGPLLQRIGRNWEPSDLGVPGPADTGTEKGGRG
jgi:NADH-quinone oxidoreductase subunit J